MLLFRDEEHVDRWCESRDMRLGEILSAQQTWDLAYGWYKDKLKADWRRHTPGEAKELLDAIGLTGPFWTMS